MIPPAHKWRASSSVPSGLYPSPASPEGTANRSCGLAVGKKAIHTLIQQRRIGN
jgi:hypothetical protein